MKRLTYNGKEYVLSRHRGGTYELVDVVTGSLLVIDEDQIASEVVNLTQHHVGVLASLIPFASRPRSFLDELRRRRRLLLEEHKKERVKVIAKGTRPSRKKKLTDMELLMAQFGLNGTKK